MLLIAVVICSNGSALVGRTSKNFDNIVRDTLSKPRWHGPAHGGLRGQSCRVLNNVLNADQIQKQVENRIDQEIGKARDKIGEEAGKAIEKGIGDLLGGKPKDEKRK